MSRIIDMIFHVLHLIFSALCGVCKKDKESSNVGEGEHDDEEN